MNINQTKTRKANKNKRGTFHNIKFEVVRYVCTCCDMFITSYDCLDVRTCHELSDSDLTYRHIPNIPLSLIFNLSHYVISAE